MQARSRANARKKKKMRSSVRRLRCLFWSRQRGGARGRGREVEQPACATGLNGERAGKRGGKNGGAEELCNPTCETCEPHSTQLKEGPRGLGAPRTPCWWCLAAERPGGQWCAARGATERGGPARRRGGRARGNAHGRRHHTARRTTTPSQQHRNRGSHANSHAAHHPSEGTPAAKTRPALSTRDTRQTTQRNQVVITDT